MPSRSIPSRNEPPVRLLLALVLTLAASPLFSGIARAADSEEARKARVHYKQGEEAFKAGRFEEAYREWQLGYQLSSRPLFLLNMAHAERRRGQLRNARALYQRFLLVDPQTKLREEIEGLLREIDSSLAAEPAGVGEQPPAPVGTETLAPPPQTAPVAPPAAPEPVPVTAPPPTAPPPTTPPPIAPLPLGRLTPPPPAPTLIDSADEPPAAPPESPPIYKRWWFWAGTGAVLAAGVAATFLLRGSPYARNGSIGTLGAPP